MTNFIKDKFYWDGMYLTYHGDLGMTGIYYFSNQAGGCHPTRHGTPRSQFIARFKYGSKPWKTWVNFIVKNFTVEEWVEMERHQNMTPVAIMRTKGFMSAQEKKVCREAGLKPTLTNYEEVIRQEVAERMAA